MAWRPLRLPGKECVLAGRRGCGRSSLLFRHAVAHVSSAPSDKSRRALYVCAVAPLPRGGNVALPARPPIGLYEGSIENWVLRRIDYCYVDSPTQLHSVMAELHLPRFEPDGSEIGLPSLILLDDLSRLLAPDAAGEVAGGGSASAHEMIQMLNSVIGAYDYAADANPHGCELLMTDIWQDDAGRSVRPQTKSKLERTGRPGGVRGFAAELSLLDLYERYVPWVGYIEVFCDLEKPVADDHQKPSGTLFLVSFEKSAVYCPPFGILTTSYEPEILLASEPSSWTYAIHTLPYLRMEIANESWRGDLESSARRTSHDAHPILPSR